MFIVKGIVFKNLRELSDFLKIPYLTNRHQLLFFGFSYKPNGHQIIVEKKTKKKELESLLAKYFTIKR